MINQTMNETQSKASEPLILSNEGENVIIPLNPNPNERER